MFSSTMQTSYPKRVASVLYTIAIVSACGAGSTTLPRSSRFALQTSAVYVNPKSPACYLK